MVQQVPRGCLVAIEFEMISGNDSMTIERLFDSLEDASAFAAGFTVADLVGRALDNDLDLFDVGAVSIGAREYIDSQLADVHILRDWDYAELTKAKFQFPPEGVEDGYVPSPL